jgi:TRAP transporter TAXI family solute receptor
MHFRLCAVAWAIVAAMGFYAQAASVPANWPASLTIGTASPGGVYLVYGRGLAPILSEALGIPVTALATQGPDQNILLMEHGDAQLGFVTMGVALQAWNGTGEWTRDKQFRAMRALFPMYDTPFQFFTGADAGIKSLAGMADRRLGIGPQGSTGGAYTPLVFKALGIPVSLRYGAWETLSDQMHAHALDGMVVSAGTPTPIVAQLDADHAIRFVGPSDAEIDTARKALPELGVSIVPAGTYSLLKSDYKTIGLFNFAVASKDLPDDLVYAIVKAFYANHDRMVAVHSSARESIVDNLKRNEALPYHPGAVRYYREIGIDLPAALIPGL